MMWRTILFAIALNLVLFSILLMRWMLVWFFSTTMLVLFGAGGARNRSHSCGR